MRKKSKDDILIEDLDDRFIIYQIDKPLISTGRKKFKPSQVASPFYGSKVVDKQAFPDNSGKLDIDYGYDYVRKDDDKHISEEELINRHGTKYYEFGIDSPKGYEEDDTDVVINHVEEEKNAFITSLDDFISEEPEEASLADIDLPNEEELKLKPVIDDLEEEEGKPQIKFNDFDSNMPKPEAQHIPSFLMDNEKPVFSDPFNEDEAMDAEDEESFADERDFDEPIENDGYYNPPVDRNITIEEAIRRTKEEYGEDLGMSTIKDMKPNYNKAPLFNEEPKSYEKPRELPRKPLTPMKYEIPYKKFLPVSEASTKELPAWLEEKKEIINQTLKDFSIDGEVISYTKGPAFTLYEIMLAPGVNVKKVNQIFDNLQMNLRAKSIRILLPIPGKNTIGVEAPNNETEIVKFGDILTDEFMNDGKPLRVALGKNIDGSPVYQDIDDMPHALIAGATKSGKSVCMNTILLSLILKNSPEDLKLILVDPKKVELSFYSELPHLATPVITDPAEATEALRWATIEMDRRFDVLSRARCKQLKDYNKKLKTDPTMEKLPFIICVVDEFNDLVMQSGQEVTDHIVRLAQKGRACGIHVILATQRPTVDVVSGTIKANIPCRIAFRVASSNDSSIILDETGAEQLLGRGDMLFKNNDAPFRAQGAFLEDDEIDNVCQYIAKNYSSDFMFSHDDLRAQINKASGALSGGKDASGEDDELLFAIAEFCVESNSCSINSIQNHFSLGFNRASRIVSLLEEMNIVSPKCGTKSREILVDSYKLREIFGVDSNV